MNKSNLFLIISIVSALTTTVVFGSVLTSVFAQGNTTMTLDNMSNVSNMSSINVTMDDNSVAIGEPQVAASHLY